MITKAKVWAIINLLTYRNKPVLDNFTVGDMGDGFYLQYHEMQVDCNNPTSGELLKQAGRKFYLSPHMIPNEVVGTAFQAILTFNEHETREWFLYRGKRIFGPHIDVDALMEVADRRVGRE